MIEGDMKPAPPIDFDHVAESLAAAAVWLDNDQPDGAIVSQFGAHHYCGAGLLLQIGADNSVGHLSRPPATWVSFSTTTQNYREHDQWTPERFTAEQHARLTELIAEHIGPIVNHWNGIGQYSGSWIAGRTPKGPAQAYARYSEGCPVHGSVFCNGWQNSDHNEGCNYISDGMMALVPPAWVTVTDEREPLPAPPEKDMRCELAAATLDAYQETILELGIHTGLFNVGTVGEVHGEIGGRVLTPGTEAIAVTMPAETFAFLMDMALRGWQS